MRRSTAELSETIFNHTAEKKAGHFQTKVTVKGVLCNSAVYRPSDNITNDSTKFRLQLRKPLNREIFFL